ncbi:glycosyltransferase family 1 protein [Candidatus Pacearchaeota archaeon]|nr:MAG: glycosyltransferase family 1 protein [Candidatus Pacearchaeota archaeon]
MRVLMFGWEFPPYNSGGLGTACEGLTRGLSHSNVDVVFVLPKKVDLDVDYIKVIFGDCESNHYVVNSLLEAYSTLNSYEGRLFFNDEKGRKIYGRNLLEEVERYAEIAREIAKKENFDIIHAHDWLTAKAAMAAKAVSGKHFILHIHATEFDRSFEGGINKEIYKIEKKGMEAADLVLAVSNYTRKKIIKHYGIPSEKVRVVHNAIDFENYALEKMHELKKNNKIVLFLGRLTLQKGPDYFVRAAKRVLEHYPDVVFVVAGSGDMESQIIRLAAELGISHKFIFAGFLRGEDKRAAYQMADLYVMPSVSEPFGLTPLESLMHGTPVLISKQSGVSEVLSNCLKADFWDVDDIANKIVAVLRYNALKRSLQENGIKEVSRMSWDEPARRCVDIYDELLRGEK